MIQKTGDYYTFDQGPSNPQNSLNNTRSPTQQQCHEAVGNVKDKIQAIRQRFLQIKAEKQAQLKKLQADSPNSIFEKIKPLTGSNEQPSNVDIQIYIPQQILKLDQKLSLIQEKLKPNEILRRKMQSKGTLVDRIKLLHDKLKTVLQKSSQIIVNNIQNYCSSLDDKEQYLKIMFLREAHTKVKGLKEEILVLEMYLKNLNNVQTKIKAIEPVSKTIETHGEILKLRKDLSQKIRQLFDHMKKTYAELLDEMDKI